MNTQRKHFQLLMLLFSMVISAAVLTICSKSSPLYPMNDWVDVNCFFTVGTSMLHGIVPYRDLYEQKGPVLYGLYAIAALISDRSFLGVFLLEVVCYGLFLYYCGSIARIYLGQSSLCLWVVLILSVLLPISPAFAHGSGAEELSLFTLAYGMYSVLNALHENRFLTFREAFLNGIFAAMVLYIKFTMLGFYIGLVLFVVIWYLSLKCQWKALLITAGQFLLGIAAVSVLVFGYFLIYGAVDDFFRVYFYNNLFLYPQETSGTRLALIARCLGSTLETNTSYALWIYLGGLLFLLQIRRHWRDGLMAVLCFLFLAVGTYWGGRGYTYYGLILAVFAGFGLIAFARLLQLAKLTDWTKRIPVDGSLLSGIGIGLCLVAVLLVGYREGKNTYLIGTPKSTMPPYRFAATIRQKENPTILNLGFLDGGFYYAADVLPSCEFFCTLNIDAPDMWETQYRCVENAQTDFVITRYYPLETYVGRYHDYQLADQTSFYFEGIYFTYYLYEKTDLEGSP